MSGATALLEAREIEIGYGRAPVIRDLSLAIERGSFVGLMGANGAGKTTLLLGLSGQYAPSAGSVRFEGRDVYEGGWGGRQESNLAYKRRIGFVHESPFFYPYLTAEEFLEFVARVKRIEPADGSSQIDSLLENLGLGVHRRKATASLSMGMRKKLALAAALLGSPDLLFLDESLNGVDLESAFTIKALLRDFVDRGGAVVLSTHVLEVVEKLASRCVLMREGRIIDDVGAEQLRRDAGSAGLEEHVLRRLRSRGRGPA